EHKLALQFGVLDNFYDSGEVSGDGHDWSTAAITSDYNEKTWQIAYRGKERIYDYQGSVADEYPLEIGEPDVDDPATGFLWDNVASHNLPYRHHGDFNTEYPDQLRADEFLDEFADFIRAKKEGKGTELPQFVLLYLPDDHTRGTALGKPRPAASVADNDLALGRVVEAVSHSAYWDDTAILALEDDAQDGADHVDAHRSIAFVVS